MHFRRSQQWKPEGSPCTLSNNRPILNVEEIKDSLHVSGAFGYIDIPGHCRDRFDRKFRRIESQNQCHGIVYTCVGINQNRLWLHDRVL
jgi:hypothetical protein